MYKLVVRVDLLLCSMCIVDRWYRKSISKIYFHIYVDIRFSIWMSFWQMLANLHCCLSMLARSEFLRLRETSHSFFIYSQIALCTWSDLCEPAPFLYGFRPTPTWCTFFPFWLTISRSLFTPSFSISPNFSASTPLLFMSIFSGPM